MRSGDTLAGIAQAIWGDASLWFKLAEANGLSGSASLTQGTTLVLPAGVVRSTYNASTLEPYNPADAIGDLTPNTPNPQAPKKNKCGVFGIILVAVIAIAVAAIAGPAIIGAGSAVTTSTATVAGIGAISVPTISAATGLTAVLGGIGAVAGSAAAIGAGVIGGAIAGAAASVVSQGVGVALGIQEKFSWSAVALAGLSGGIGAGLGGVIPGSGIIANVGRGVAGSALTQGVAVATGLQSKFDFVGVAAAGIGAGVGGALGGAIGNRLGDFGGRLVTSTASGLANAATRSAIEGSSFGRNIIAALPDVIGQAVGAIVAEGVTSALSDRATVDYLQREGGLSRADARQLLKEAKLSGLDQAGGINIPNADLKERRGRLNALEEKLISSGKAQDPKFVQFKRLYELSLISGDVYYNQSDRYVTGDFARLDDNQVSQATKGALKAADLVDKKSGYFSAIYRNDKTSELIYANRGTEIGQAGDRGADVLQAIGRADPQYTRAKDNAESLRDNGVRVTFTGHSLGGGLATAQAIVSGYRAVVFNPASVHANTVGGATRLARQNDLVTNVTVNGEFLSSFQDGGKSTMALIFDAATGNPRAAPGDHFRRLAAEVPSAGGRRLTLAPAYLSRPRGAYFSVPRSQGGASSLLLHGINSVADSLFYHYEQGWR